MTGGKEKPIKAYVRIRPLNKHEIHREDEVAVEIYPGNSERVRVTDLKCCYDTSYKFDRVFDASDSNKTVFHYTARENLIRLLNGTNCSLIAYGETGSGKTHTLMESEGITDYAISYLFKLMDADEMHNYRICCSFVQVYAEKIYDILSNNPTKELHLREHPSKGVYVQGLSEHVISKESHVSEIFARGKLELIRARTEMHHLSSRSHSIFQITIQRTLASSKKQSYEENAATSLNEFNRVPQGLTVLLKGTVVCGKLDICDLAGSERLDKTLVHSVNQTEAKYINSSLLHLGNVICALAEKKQRHIPFRNSTLTRLLQECLGSECLTAFIICVSPSSNEIHETKCSLNFGSRARAITNRFRYHRRAINHELLTKNLSTKIRLLEKQLFEKSFHHVPLVCSDSHAQTEEEENACIFVDMVEQTMELSQFLSKCVLYNDDGNASDEGMQRPPCHSPSKLFSETCCKSPAKSPGKTMVSTKPTDTQVLTGLLIKRISETMAILQGYLRATNVVKKETECMDTKSLSVNDKNIRKMNILGDTGWTLSDMCSGIKDNVEYIGKVILHEKEFLPEEKCNKKRPSWYRRLTQLLCDMTKKDLNSYDNDQFALHFIYLSQLIQIFRLSVEYSRENKNQDYPLNPMRCSMSVENGGVNIWRENSTTTDVLNPTVTSIAQEYLKQPRSKTSFDRKHFRKRRRHKTSSSSNQYKHNLSSLSPFPLKMVTRVTFPQLKSRKLKKQGKRQRVRMEEEKDEGHLNSVYASTVSRYDELRRKYAEAMSENDELFLKLDKLEEEVEREREDRVQITSFEDDRDMYFATKDDKMAELEHLQEEYNRYRIKVNDSERSVQQLSERIVEIESRIKERDDIILNLEAEKRELIRLQDESIEKKNGMRTMHRNLKSFREFFESRVSISEELLSISETAVNCKTTLNKAKFREIDEVEREIFDLVESNVRYEKSLEDVRKKVLSYLHFINEMESKLSEKSISPGNEEEESQYSEHEQESTSLIPPISPSTCDFKLLEQALCDDLAMQNILVGDFHKSTERNQAGKDLKLSQLIKELLREKLKLQGRIEKLQHILQKLENKVVNDKEKIEMFVKQLGQLDQQLDGVVPTKELAAREQRDTLNCTKNSEVTERDMELVEVSEMSYDNLSTFMQYFADIADEGYDEQSDTFCTLKKEKVRGDESLDELRSEVNYYKRKCNEMMSQSNELNDCLREDLESTNKSLMCKIDYLKHTNSIIEKEIKRAKKRGVLQRNKLKILKDKNIKFSEQVNVSMFQSQQMEAKVEITKLQLEKHLSKYKARKSYLEKCVMDLVETTSEAIESGEEEVDEEEEECEGHDGNDVRDESSFNDSGVPPEDLSDC